MTKRKIIRQIKRMISMWMLILSYTIQQVILNVCAKFQIPRYSSSRAIFDTNFHMHYIGVKDGKNGKEGKINFSIMIFFTKYT